MGSEHSFREIDREVPRLESLRKATGQAKYTDDLRLPNMAYAALVRSPYSRARVVRIDVSEAEKVPGYIGCLLPEETPEAYFNCSGNPPSPLLMRDETVLTMEPKVLGDRIACVAAESETAAREAADAVKVEYHKKRNAIRLLYIIGVVDVGTPINRMTVAGQLEGGIAQGVGYALYERIEVNPRSKRPMSSDLLHYRIPEMDDMPQTHVDMVDSYAPYGPHGAKSVGELATVPVAPTIVNAVRHASGQELNSLPLCDRFVILPSGRKEAYAAGMVTESPASSTSLWKCTRRANPHKKFQNFFHNAGLSRQTHFERRPPPLPDCPKYAYNELFVNINTTTFAVNLFHAYASQKRFTARSPVGYHFTVRPFVVIDRAVGGASEGIWKSILFTGLVPTKSSTFAVLQF